MVVSGAPVAAYEPGGSYPGEWTVAGGRPVLNLTGPACARSPLAVSTVIEFACGGEAGAAPVWTVESEVYTDCAARIRVTSPLACPEPMSTGAKVLTATFAVLVVYLAGGAYYLRTREGKSGLDLVPNRAAWAELPGLVADGFAYVRLQWHRVREPPVGAYDYDELKEELTSH